MRIYNMIAVSAAALLLVTPAFASISEEYHSVLHGQGTLSEAVLD